MFGLTFAHWHNPVNNAPQWITDGDLGTIGTSSSVNIQIQASDPEWMPVWYALVEGSLPLGLSMSETGLITGKAVALETHVYSFRVEASDPYNVSASRWFSLTVITQPSQLNTTTYGGVSVPQNYTYTSSNWWSSEIGTYTNDFRLYGTRIIQPNSTEKLYLEFNLSLIDKNGSGLNQVSLYIGLCSTSIDFISLYRTGSNQPMSAGQYRMFQMYYSDPINSIVSGQRVSEGSLVSFPNFTRTSSRFSLLVDMGARTMALWHSGVQVATHSFPVPPNPMRLAIRGVGNGGTYANSNLDRTGMSLAMNFGQTAYTYTAPAGYGVW